MSHTSSRKKDKDMSRFTSHKTLTKLRGSNTNSLEKYDHSPHVAMLAGEATFTPTSLIFSTNPYENVAKSVEQRHERDSRRRKVFFSALALTTIALLVASYASGVNVALPILLGCLVVMLSGLIFDFGCSMNGKYLQEKGWRCIEIPFAYNHRGLAYLTREDVSCITNAYLHDPDVILDVIWNVSDHRYRAAIDDERDRVEKAVNRGYQNISPKTVLRKELEESFEEHMEIAQKSS